MKFRVEIARPVGRHLGFLSGAQRALVLDAIEDELSREPTVRTKHREPLRPNDLATWELRVGALRVYYDVVLKPQPLVIVLAVGIKDRTRVLIGGEEIAL